MVSKRWITTLTALVTGGAAALLPFQAGADPAGAATTPVAVSASGPSTLPDRVVPLTGSSDGVVILRTHRLAGGAAGFGAQEGRLDEATAALEWHPMNGSGISIIAPTAGQDEVWSLSGTFLTAVRTDGDGDSTGLVDWWNFATGLHGTFTLASGQTYEGAGPRGMLVATGAVLSLHQLTGTTTTIGQPFVAAPAFVTTDATGLVATDGSGHAWYTRWAAPADSRLLTTGTTGLLGCNAMSATYVACNAGDYNQDNDTNIPELDPTSTILVPLSGAAPTTSTTCPGGATLAGNTLAWSGGCNEHVIYRLQAGAPRPTTVHGDYEGGLIQDGVRALVTGPRPVPTGPGVPDVSDSTLDGFDAAGNPATVAFAATASPTSVGAFTLVDGAVVYTDDHASTDPTTMVRLVRRSIAVHGTQLSLGAQQVLAAGTGPAPHQVLPQLIAASDEVTVFADRYQPGETATLHVTDGTRTRALPGAVAYGNVLASGPYVVYQVLTSRGDTDVMEFDAATGALKVLRTVKAQLDASSTAIDGTHLAYALTTGAVYYSDLTTGTTVLVSPAIPNYFGQTSVYLSGSWVGWHTALYGQVDPTDHNEIRNVATMAPAITLAHTLWSLTPQGALMDSVGTSVAPAGEQGLSGPTAFWLRSFSGPTTVILPLASYVAGPQLVDGVLAYADADGVLRAQPFSAP